MAKKGNSNETLANPIMRPGLIWVYILLGVVMSIYFYYNTGGPLKEITWKQFEEEMFLKGDVAKLDVVNGEHVEVYIKSDSIHKKRYEDLKLKNVKTKPSPGPHYFFTIGSEEVFHDQIEKSQEKRKNEGQVSITYTKRVNWFQNIFSWILPFLILIVLSVFIMRRAMNRQGIDSAFSFGKSKARLMESGMKPKVTFKDVAGLQEAKEEIYELVKFLKFPEKYRKLGAKIPKGILLLGPPGTGKTLLAKAVAGEAGVPFFSLSGSEFVEMFVGVGAARMRDLFEKAKSKAPSIIFIDEIDTIGRSRGNVNAFQTNDERESTLNQLLAELDGFDTETGVIVLAATNRGDILDPALLRPGRFDRHIHLELPSLIERKEIFEVHLKPLKLSKKINSEMLAAQTPGFSGADIANICNEAALIAAREEKNEIEIVDFLAAIDRVIGGLEKKSKIITAEEKRRIAFHEAGHVTTGWFLEHAHPVLKVSIIPRGKSLGAAWYLPQEHQVITRSEFFENICVSLGGRVAEKLTFDEVSSNAMDDLEKVTKLAYAMVVNYGLSEAFPNLSYYDSSGRAEFSMNKPYSEKTAEIIDEEVKRIIDSAYRKTTEILKSHQAQLNKLAEELIEKEILQKEDIEKILGKEKKKKGKE